MKTEYFNLRCRSKPSANGVVIKLSDGKLEVIAGRSDNHISLDNEGNILYDKLKYLFIELDEETAVKMKEDYEKGELMQGYVATHVADRRA